MSTTARLLASTFLLAVAALGAPNPLQAQTNSELHGGWIISDWQAPDGQAGPTPQRGVFVFSASGHYSMMYIIGEDREPLGANPTEADLAAAYGPLVANSGRYTVSGNEISYEAYVSKDPAYMAAFAPTGGAGNAQTMTFAIENGLLTLSYGEGGPMEGATATLRRPPSE